MIPKTIHYCWFGKKRKSKLINDCIKSWKIHCPDFKIIEWNEKNTDLSLPFLQKAYKDKKWAFVADYVRFKALSDHGGIYLDTDMLVLKPLQEFLNDDCFFGAEETEIISCGIIGTNKENQFIKDLLAEYKMFDTTMKIDWKEIIVTKIVTKAFKLKFDFKQSIDIKKYNDITIYPPNFFYPLPFNSDDVLNYEKYIKRDSYTIHLWAGSWIVHNEFNFIRNREYFKAIKIIINNLFSRKVNYKYIRKIASSFKQSLSKK
ncbi:glycosyl transferase-like sugar-binding protein [Flavobacterium cutihirudinis]|uniref:Glycosyl transferase-like sugar-binding protein n=1 Tax=Flavobacterium cutihirudinis TaxID=1265740 RepID=A0A3D9FKP0_9FLAO|nr:glycosyltransferase [Flavobacterium cutihirudinis]RED19582.1 glycosyl transferase-like sugar-binding protein [Flavobacterium cutihirudinis]